MPKVKGMPSSKVMLSKKEAKQVRGLIQGETKETPFVTIVTSDTRSNPTALRVDGVSSSTGLLQTSQDSVTIKWLELRGTYQTTAVAMSGTVVPIAIRRIVVWWYKYALDTGNLPGSDKLMTVSGGNSIESMIKNPDENAGSFKILSDKTFDLGTNTTVAVNGKTRINVAEKVMVGKNMHFYENTTVATPLAGVAGSSGIGVVSHGLLCVYHIYEGDAGTLSVDMNARVVYVG